jgi:hypothetical protein
MDARDLDLRNLTYRRFVELGRAPTLEELGAREEVLASWRRLHDQHALVLDGEAIRMANPFSGVPTPYRVLAGGRWWYANCGWDAFGICAALGPTAASSIVTSSSRFATGGPTTSRSCSTASCQRRTGGTTSSTPEAR